MHFNALKLVTTALLTNLERGAAAFAVDLAPRPPPTGDPQQCNGQWYNPLEYTCYNDKSLCPFINGFPMSLCGDACYLDYQYGCDSTGNLTQLPLTNQPFKITGVNWLSLATSDIQACGNKFYMKDGGPCTYCPTSIVGDACPPGTDTVLVRGQGMYTLVPGGQRYYIHPTTGALQFTIPHSGATPPGAIFGVQAWENGVFLLPGTNGWMACPASLNETVFDNSTMKSWQVFAQLPAVTFAPNCLSINILTETYQSNSSAAAWEYV